MPRISNSNNLIFSPSEEAFREERAEPVVNAERVIAELEVPEELGVSVDSAEKDDVPEEVLIVENEDVAVVVAVRVATELPVFVELAVAESDFVDVAVDDSVPVDVEIAETVAELEDDPVRDDV